MSRLVQDVRYALRTFRKKPAAIIAAIICLGLGFGGACAIFSIVYGVLMHPFVYKDTARIAVPTFSQPDSDARRPMLAYTVRDFFDLQKDARAFDSIMLWTQNTVTLGGNAPLRNVNVLRGSSNFFQFLGTPAAYGRTFAPADVPHADSPPQIAVISYDIWIRQFNGQSDVIGRHLIIRDRVYTIIGVMPPRFTWFDSDIYVPATLRPGEQRFANVFFRLRSGVSLRQAAAELQLFTQHFAKRTPADYPTQPFRVYADRLQDWLYGKLTGKLLILMAAASVLLMIACVNICVLLLSQSNARRKEVAMRIALGATSGRILTQLLTETLLLVLAGCAFGAVIGRGAVPAILRILPETAIPHEAVVRLNLPALGLALVAAIAASVLISTAIWLSLRRGDLNAAISVVNYGNTSGRAAGRARAVLLTAEIALTTILLGGSGIAVRNVLTVQSRNLGYDPQDVAVATVPISRGKNSWEQRRDYFAALHGALLRLPGVSNVAETLTAPPPRIEFESPITLGNSPASGRTTAAVALVSSAYFETLRIRLTRGRTFTPAEVAAAAPLAIVNEAFARQFANRRRDAVGSYLAVPALDFKGNEIPSPPGHKPVFQIVGVISNVVNQGLLDAVRPAVYVPYTYALADGMTMLMRTKGNPLSYEETIRRTLHSFVDADQPLADFDTLEHILAVAAVEDPRASAILFSVFAVFALTIAAAGLYSVLALQVSQRRQEFGIRLALGARPRSLASLVLRSTLQMALLGIATGIIAGAASGKILAYYEQGWRPFDPTTLLAVCALQIAVALGASWGPVSKAAGVSPQSVLRAE